MLLAELFDRVGVSHVWCIDDRYSSQPSVEDIANAIAAGRLDDDLLTSISGLKAAGSYRLGKEDVDRVEVLDALAGTVRNDQLDAHELDILRSGISEEPDDWFVLGQLRRHVTAAEVEFEPLGPDDWPAARQRIHGDGSGHLFLVDQHLGDNYRPGLDIAAQIADDHSAARIAVLTNAEPFDPAQAWRANVASTVNTPQRLGWVLKGDVSRGELALTRALRRVFVLPELGRFRDAVVRHHRNALKDAAARLQGIDEQDLHEAFFSSQLGEGADETEVMSTLLRRQIELGATQLQWEDHDLAKTSGKLRNVALGIPKESRTATQALVTLQQEAFYDMGQHVAASAFPLLPGDIIAVMDEEQWWSQDAVQLLPESRLFLVVGQACDLAVRDTGARSGEPASVDVVEVKAWEGNEPPQLGQLTRSKQLLFGLPYLLARGGHAYATLRSHALPALALDLAVLNSTGRAIAIPEAELSPWVLPGWRRRHSTFVRQQVADKTQVLERLHRLPKSTRPAVRDALAASSTDLVMGLVRIELRDGVLGFNLARVGRLAPHIANALVSAVRAAQSRPAFERPLIDPEVELDVSQ